MAKIDWSKAGKRLRHSPPEPGGRNPDWNFRLQRWKVEEEYVGEALEPHVVNTLAACPLCGAPVVHLCQDARGQAMAEPHAERVFAAGAAEIERRKA